MEVDRLEIAIEAEAQRASAQLDLLAKKISAVGSTLTSVNTGGMRNFATGTKELASAIQTLSGIKTTDFNRIAKGVEKLGNINMNGLLDSSYGILKFVNALNYVGEVSDDAVKLGEIAGNISKLGSARMLKTAETLPKLSAALKEFTTTLSSAPNVSENIISMTNAMANLASNGAKFSSTVNGLGRAAKTLTQSNTEATATTNAFSKVNKSAISPVSSMVNQLNKLVGAYFTLKYAIGGVAGSVKKSMDFVETVNLFQTSYKKIGLGAAQNLGMSWGSASADSYAKAFIDRAQSFNDRLTNSLSLDPNTMMNYQAVFANISNSMGLTANTAENLSESLTLLGNDMASLWNINTSDAMTKLQAGLTGQVRPLRELGVDTTQASLQLTAYKYGIKDSVKDMSQAAKVQLRWLTIMNQSSVAFGDMAKTINSPANQLRILKQQWENLSRTLGNVFLPIITTVLPYINGTVIALRNMFSTLATSMGFELPDYTNSKIYNDASSGIDGISDSADKATRSTKKATEANEKYKKSLMGFDELNILSDNSSSSSKKSGSGSGSGVSGGTGYSKLDDAVAKKTSDYMKKWNDQMANMQNKASDLAKIIQPKIEKFVWWVKKLSPLFEGIAAAFITYKVITWFEKLATAIGALSMSPAGVIAIAVGALFALYEGIKKYNRYITQEDLAKRFGDIKLSLEDVKEIADKLTSSEYTAKINIYVSENEKLDDLKQNITNDLESINKYAWKVDVGLGLNKDEKASYKSAISSYVSDAETYAEQQNYVVDLAIDAVVQDNGKFNNEITSMVDEYYSGAKSKMQKLGKKLRSTMDNALADGVIDSTEQKTITNLIKEINEITKQVSDAQFKAEMQMITVDGDLTPDSFKNLTDKISKTIDKNVKSAEKAQKTALVGVDMTYQAKIDKAKSADEKARLQAEWDSSVKKLGEEFSKTKVNVILKGFNFSIDTLTGKYGKELSYVDLLKGVKYTPDVSDILMKNFKKSSISTTMNQMVAGMTKNFQDALIKNGMSEAAKEGLADFLKKLEPTTKQLRTIYDDAVKMGSQVPEGTCEALTKASNLGAISGDVDSIAFLLGQKLSTDPKFLELLSKSKDAGNKLNSNLIEGLRSRIPDLKQAGGRLVFNLDSAIKNASNNSAKNNMPAYSQMVANSYASTFSSDKTLGKAVKSWLSDADKVIKNWKFTDVGLPVLYGVGMSKDLYNVLTGSGNKKTSGWAIRKKPSGYATGGFPEDGLFFANHTELVGKFANGKTAVVNNSQIVESVSKGVYDAVHAALSDTSGGRSKETVIENVLNLDGDVLYRSAQKAKKDREGRYRTVAYT